MFEKDMVMGNALDPVQLSVQASAIEDHVSVMQSPALVAYPNPFDERLNIEVELLEPAKVRLAVYDIYGKCIEVVAEEEMISGIRTIRWDPPVEISGPVILEFNDGYQSFHRRMIKLEY